MLPTTSDHQFFINMQQRRLFSSNSDDKSHERPHMYQLEHIQKRLEFTVPLIFQMRMDWTFYRKDVVLENQILQITRHGLHEVMNHIGIISLCGKIRCPSIEVEALSIMPILEDGTVRLRWRIHYLTWLQILNPRNYNDEQRKKNLKWYDGYSIFHVDGDGLVYKWTLQKTTPDDSSLESTFKDKTKKLVKRVVMPGTANCQQSDSSTYSMNSLNFSANCIFNSKANNGRRMDGKEMHGGGSSKGTNK